jgi:uncharacterized 2Fe-2S/4Fe-4S cluster protein (DUF4445 family)
VTEAAAPGSKERSALVVFMPSGKRGRFAPGTRVLAAARELGVDIDSVCGGRGICGRCRVGIPTGEFAREGITSSPDHLDPLTNAERKYARRQPLANGERLSCHATIEGDLMVDVPAESQVHRQVICKDHEARAVDLDPVLRLYMVDVPKPEMDAPSGDSERLLAALASQWELERLELDPSLLPSLQSTLRAGGWQVTVAVRDQRHVVAAWPGFRGPVLGVAVDVGSTTIAAHLCDLSSGDVLATAGAMNPQIRLGEDLMSRVSYAMLNEGGAQELTALVRTALGELIEEVCRKAGAPAEDVLELCIVGNPVMHHLVLGIDPTPLGTAPFALATDAAVQVGARDMDLPVHRAARVYLPPCIAGHVGADTAAVLLAETPWDSSDVSLIVDVGTNAEIVVGNRDRLVAASSPTGPAFEGAQISCGQRAAPGAIERVRIDRQTLEPRFRVIGCDLWSDDPGFEAAAPPITGICGSGIIEAVAEMFLAGIVDADGAIVGGLADRTSRIEPDGRTWGWVLSRGTPEVRIVQTDVRAIQLAKGALYAGARLLMEELGVDRVDRIRLAGAFGSTIDVTHAMVLGMIPDCELDAVSAAGNAAGTGARIALLSGEARRQIERRVRSIDKIETAVAPRFQQHFVNAMALPNKVDPFPALSREVELPERTAGGGDQPRRRRRRRPGAGAAGGSGSGGSSGSRS